jgi:hypothetical protein
MAELPVSESRPASGGNAVGRLFVLELNARSFDEYGWLRPTVRERESLKA